MSETGRLSGKSAIVTGADSGISQAITITITITITFIDCPTYREMPFKRYRTDGCRP